VTYILADSDPESKDWVDRLKSDLALLEVEIRSNSSSFQPGSIEWKYAIEADIPEASCFLYFTSTEPEQIQVLSRVSEIASEYGVRFIPVAACEDQYAGALRCALQTIGKDKPLKRMSVKYLPQPIWNMMFGISLFSGLVILAVGILALMLAGIFGNSLQESLGYGLIDLTNYNVPGITWYFQNRVLFEDDFENGAMDNWISSSDAWKIVQEPGTDNHVLQGSSRDWAQVFSGDTAWRNYAFEARVRIARYNNPPYGTGLGILFHQTEYAQCDSAFYIWRPSLDYAILAEASEGTAEGCGEFDELDLVPFSLPINEWFTVRVEVFGNALHGYVENELVTSAIIPDYLKNGRIGFQVPPSNVVWFDDPRVVELKAIHQ
jgi:hypothetical protein